MEEPFYVLYVLVVSRGNEEPGRYQSSDLRSKQDLSNFLNRFERFLESDGRHHLWIKSVGEPDLLVYDKHSLIYCYGRLEEFKKILKTATLAETHRIKIPSPHVHHDNKEYDADCQRLLGCWNWQRSPLREQDED